MNTQLSQTHIQHLAQQINPLHQSCRADRIKLADWEDDGLRPTGGHRPFSILGELEILASHLQGYAGQFTHDRLDATAIADLQQRNPFVDRAIADWYFTQGKDYPDLCRYLELLDYLRLSLLSAVQQSSLQAA
jgi:hypothetical protein